MKKKMTVVIPAYNEELMVSRAAAEVRETLDEAGIPYELIFIDDGSRDRTWAMIRETSSQDPNVRGLCFSRNFGKETAIFAGLSAASGECTAVMDCDLQHPPQVLPVMYRLWEDGYQIVEGVKKQRSKEAPMYRKMTGFFYKIMSASTGADLDGASDFKLLDREVVRVILSMPERSMFFRATTSWVGFKTIKTEYNVQEREAGESKWTTTALFRYALNNIAAFSTVPLQIVTFMGVACFICSLVLMIYSLFQYFFGRAVEGYTTLLIVLLFIGSAIMVSLGIIGYFIGKIYDEVRQRPRYIISETTGFPEEHEA